METRASKERELKQAQGFSAAKITLFPDSARMWAG